MRYENLTATENYTMIAKNLKKHFTDEPLAYMILEFLYDEALKFNSFGLLTEDMSFYCPVSKIIEMFDGNVSNKTVIEKIKIIEKRNFIKKTSAKILKRPNYYRINFEKIKEIARDKKITVCNDIPTEPANYKEPTELAISDFTKCPNKFLEIFNKDYNEMVLLLRLMNTMEDFNSRGKLQDDTSFYLSLTKMIEMFQGNISKPTLLKHLDNLEKKGFISKIKSNNPKQANFYIINCEKINKLCDTKTREIFEEDEIPQEPAEETPVVAKNATVENQDGYNLKPTDNKEKSTELAIVEKSPSNQEYCERIKIAWNAIASRYETTPNVTVVTEVRLKHFKNLLKYYKIDEKQFFNSVNKALSESKFLRGIGKKWRADYDFFINKNSYLKAIEGAYRDNPNEIMEILQDPAKMSFKEAQELRDKIEMEKWLHDEEKEEPKALP